MKKGYALCKENNHHHWCPTSGPSVDSCGESLDEMEVIFTCEECGAEASGTVYWEDLGEAE